MLSGEELTTTDQQDGRRLQTQIKTILLSNRLHPTFPSAVELTSLARRSRSDEANHLVFGVSI